MIMKDKTAEIVIQPKPETKDPLAANQLKTYTLDLILNGEVKDRRSGISMLTVRATDENWSQSQDIRQGLLYYDLHMAECSNKLEGIRMSFFEKPMTPEATQRLRDLEKRMGELRTERNKFAPEIDDELKSTNIIGLLANEFTDPQKPWIAESIEKDPVNTFYWIINSYDGEARMLAWMDKHGFNNDLIEFYKDKHDGRLFDYLENFEVKATEEDEMVGLDSGIRSLIKNTLIRRHGDLPLEAIRRFKSLLDDPENNDRLAHLLQLTSDQFRRSQHERFKRGEIDFLPNIQENLRPIILVDLYGRLLSGGEPKVVFTEWHNYWGSKPWNEEKTEKFVELLLDEGYPSLTDHPPVTEIDRSKIVERLRYLMSQKPREETEANGKNRAMAERPIDEISVSDKALIHETDFSLLQQLLSSGILANELTYQSRNAASGRESDLSASFWRLDIARNQGTVSLRETVDVFYPKEARGVKTGANLRNRVVVCALEPTGPEDQEFFMYPPYSDAMQQYDTNAPLTKKFTSGWDNNHMPTQYNDIRKDAVFVLLGLPPTRFSFVIVPPNLKDRYTNLAKNLPFYLPAYSSETGEKLF